jgi:ubiquinone/menaquinone biosynthesis C-methylase UbiE
VNKLFHEINLKKIIEEKLTNNNRVMNTIGRPIQIEFNQKKDLTLSENAAKVYFKKVIKRILRSNFKENLFLHHSKKVTFHLNGRLNSGEMTMELYRETDQTMYVLFVSLKLRVYNFLNEFFV